MCRMVKVDLQLYYYSNYVHCITLRYHWVILVFHVLYCLLTNVFSLQVLYSFVCIVVSNVILFQDGNTLIE